MIRRKNTGQIIVISAPSGAGKGTVIAELLKNDDKSRWLSVSATSRGMREGEKEGVNYYYLTEDEFKKKIDEDYFLEYTNYAGNFYGTPKEHIKKHLEKGIDVILEIEIEGATNIKKLIPEALFIFIMPPSLKALVKRLKGRGTETNDKIIKRFHEAYKEINEVTKYNYVVVNDEIQDTVNTIEAIIKAEKCRVDRIEEVYLDTKEEEIHELLMQEDFDNQGLAEKID
ncbi:MAG: guanylate kinase [Bacilli bacterium]|nr:guanylate kinase [Bacilli bacterium]